MMIGVQLEQRQRHAALDAPLELEQLQVHVDRVGKLGMPFSQRPQLDGLPRFRSRRARWRHLVGHAADHTQAVSSSGVIGPLSEAWVKAPGRAGRPMRILMVASEALPFAKTGGLADVLGALPRALARLGHEVDVVMPALPRHRRREQSLRASGGARRSVAAMRRSIASERDGVRIVFVDHPDYFDRDYLYGTGGHDYPDNPERFAFLRRRPLNWARAGEATLSRRCTRTTGRPACCRCWPRGCQWRTKHCPAAASSSPFTTWRIRACSTPAGCRDSGWDGI